MTSPGAVRARASSSPRPASRARLPAPRIGARALSLSFLLGLGTGSVAAAEGGASPTPSVAREWNEAQLTAIRGDRARPPVHARNLFHVAAAMYDAWAVYDARATPLYLVPDAPEPACRLTARQRAAYRKAAAHAPRARERALGMAAWRTLERRFANAPNARAARARFAAVAARQGLRRGGQEPLSPAALGARAAACIAQTGAVDGANERGDYANRRYAPRNPPLDPKRSGNPTLVDPNRWQPLALARFVDQSGQAGEAGVFVGADWGEVAPFALRADDRSTLDRDGVPRSVWLDPGPPPMLGESPAASVAYARNHALVALWSAHLDPADGVTVDISPGAIGDAAPGRGAPARDPFEQLSLYAPLEGGSSARGHPLNPATARPYAPNRVPRGDYTRVIAEYWADGPDSETPPGHWFRLYNEHVAAHPELSRRIAGEGAPVDPLEYDVHAYLALGGALHDAAIAAWSLKAAYDWVRPISAIRHLAERAAEAHEGGSGATASDAPRRSERVARATAAVRAARSVRTPGSGAAGRGDAVGDGGSVVERPARRGEASPETPLLPLVPGRIERVEAGDPLAGADGRHVGQIKLYAWRGPDAVVDPRRDTAGVGWILARDWWPYQRSDFVTPPFAGYVSGHSTFSRAAAEVLERLTGDAFFPGGLAEFVARRDAFLDFERGPSVDVTLQWATYRDAADQSGLSRIWGGIHPPVDDLPGRRIGAEVGARAWERARALFEGRAAPRVAPARASAVALQAPRPRPDARTELPPLPHAADGAAGCRVGGGGRDATLALLLAALALRSGAGGGRRGLRRDRDAVPVGLPAAAGSMARLLAKSLRRCMKTTR